MAENSKIEWTDASWTPIRAHHVKLQSDGGGKERVGWHCEHVSEGCRNCYAEGMNRRLGTGLDFKPANLYRPDREGYCNGEARLFLDTTMLYAPLRWRRPRMIFVCSMTDLFADFVPDTWLDQTFAVMALCPQHTFQVLTKRPARMREYLTSRNGMGNAYLCEAIGRIPAKPGNRPIALEMPLRNVWLGASVEDQRRADERVPVLMETPAALRFVSIEPMLGPIDIRPWLSDDDGCEECDDGQEGASNRCMRNDIPREQQCPRKLAVFTYPEGPRDAEGCPEWIGQERTCLNWVIVGGESGPNARPMHPAWPRALRDQCAAAKVPFFFKQWGEWTPGENVPGTRRYPAMTYFDGEWLKDDGEDWTAEDERGPVMFRVGKKAAGAWLDGREHREMPA